MRGESEWKERPDTPNVPVTLQRREAEQKEAR